MRAASSSRVLALAGVLAAISGAVLGCRTLPPPPTPDRLPAIAPLPLAEARPLAEQVAGKVAVIDLWASWCQACITAVPALIEFERTHQAAGLIVVGVSVGDTPDLAARFAKAARIPYALYVDPEFHFADALGAREVPTLLVMDRSGRIVHRARSLDAQTRTLLAQLLAP